MRIVGRDTSRPPGLGWPPAGEIQWTVAMAAGVVWRHPKGVVRYRNHQEADDDMRRIIADGMVEAASRLVPRGR
jgi:hypothetical protein